MKNMTEGIKSVFHKMQETVTAVTQLNNEEERALHKLRIQANVSRINIMVVVIFILECANTYILLTTSNHLAYQKQYLIANIAMIAACIIQIVYFHIIEWKDHDNIKKKKRYIKIWILQFTIITWCFHALEFMEDRHYENMFLLLLVLNIILILQIKEILICTGIIIILEYGFLVYIGGETGSYELVFALTACAGMIGRIFFVYYMNSNLLQWKLKKANEELNEQINRYKTLQKLTKEDIFEYHHKEDKLVISYASGKSSKVYYNYLKKLKKHYIGFFSEKDEKVILQKYDELKMEHEMQEKNEMETFTFCSMEKDGTEKKYEVLYTTIFDDLEEPVLTIGKLYKQNQE